VGADLGAAAGGEPAGGGPARTCRRTCARRTCGPAGGGAAGAELRGAELWGAPAAPAGGEHEAEGADCRTVINDAGEREFTDLSETEGLTQGSLKTWMGIGG